MKDEELADIKPNTVKHKKFTIPVPWNHKWKHTVTYYIAEIRTPGFQGFGDFLIHEKIQGNDEGYGGSVVKFLMEDGTIEEVKGPFYKYKSTHIRILWYILTKEPWIAGKE